MSELINHKNTRWLFAMAFGICLAFIVNNASNANPPNNAGIKIGIVDLGILFNQYKGKAALEIEIQKRKEKVEVEIDKLTKNARKLNEELEDYKGEKAALTQIAIEQLIHERDLKGKYYKNLLGKEMADKTVVMLDTINAAITAYGKKNGYTVIFKIDNEGFGKEQFREKIFRAQVQSILYYDTAIDLTPVILKTLNK